MSSIHSSFSCLAFIVIFLIHCTHSQCSDLTTDTCAADGYCSLNADSDCLCSKSFSQDIAFIFDSSMASTQWTHSMQFAINLLYYGSPTDTRAAVIATDDSNIDPTPITRFNNTLQHTMNALLTLQTSQPSQSLFYLQKSIQIARDLFIASSTSNQRRVLVIFAANEFEQSPCSINLRNDEIYAYSIAIGSGWNKYPLICVGSSEHNYEGLITDITDASQLPALLPRMERITCPHHPLLKVTEIQFNGIAGAQYIEVYNYGHAVDLSALTLHGFATGALSSSSSMLAQGQTLVIYNGVDDASTIPSCLAINCACAANPAIPASASFRWCADALYLACCDASNPQCATSIHCVFSDAVSVSASWTIGIEWQSQMMIESLTFDEQWPLVAADSHFSLELRRRGYNNAFGSSWSMSCNAFGTPGDSYIHALALNACAYDCSVDGDSLCALNHGGSSSGGCSGALCACLPGYYPWFDTCYALPAPSNCVGIFNAGAFSAMEFEPSAWDGDTKYAFFHCAFATTGCRQNDVTVSSDLNPFIYDPGRAQNATQVALAVYDSTGVLHVSATQTCAQVTATPTLQPTMAPTFSLPSITECSAWLSADLKSMRMDWTQLDDSQQGLNTPPVTALNGYAYYLNGNRLRSVACCTAWIVLDSPFVLASDFVSISGDWDSTHVTQLQETQSATNCSVFTQSPTESPTWLPTQTPTVMPTLTPTHFPTLSPTLQPLFVPSCTAFFISSSRINITWQPALFDPLLTASPSDTFYIVAWRLTDGTDDARIVASDVNSQVFNSIDFVDVEMVFMYCRWNSYTSRGVDTVCSLRTTQPTATPIAVPSPAPTLAPTLKPTPNPTFMPTKTPTVSPTFVYPNVGMANCSAVFSISLVRNQIHFSWPLNHSNNVSNKLSPPNSWIRYHGVIDGAQVMDISYTAVAKECFDDGVCFGVASAEISSSDFEFSFDSIASMFVSYTNPDGIQQHVTSSVNCSVNTAQPTFSPTLNPTSMPTFAPTFGTVYVYLENTGCEEPRCGCSTPIGEASNNSSCCHDSCVWDFHPAPIIMVSEKEYANTTFYVRRSIAQYPYAIEVQYRVSAVTQAIADAYGFMEGIRQIESNVSYTIPDDCYFDAWDDPQCQHFIENAAEEYCYDGNCSWCDFTFEPGPRCNDIQPMRGQFVIPYTTTDDEGVLDEAVEIGQFETASFALSILREGCANGCDFDGEVFMLELTQCAVLENWNNRLSETELKNKGVSEGDAMHCALVYPSRAFVIVVNQDQENRSDAVVIPDTSSDDWLWYAIVAVVIAITFMAYFGYRWWVNRKMDRAHFGQVEDDVGAVIEDNESAESDPEEEQLVTINRT